MKPLQIITKIILYIILLVLSVLIICFVFGGSLISVFLVYLMFDYNSGKIQNSGPKTMVNTTITKSYFLPEPMTKNECLHYSGSTKVKMTCNRDIDYWAGAVSQCGGVHNLLTYEQLQEIVRNIYHDNQSEYDEKIAVKYGLPKNPDDMPDNSIIIMSKDVDFF